MLEIILSFAPVASFWLAACISNSRYYRGGTPAAWSRSPANTAAWVSSPEAVTIIKGRAV